jgi:hypothetical protein
MGAEACGKVGGAAIGHGGAASGTATDHSVPAYDRNKTFCGIFALSIAGVSVSKLAS